jgi:hypothetical protein
MQSGEEPFEELAFFLQNVDVDVIHCLCIHLLAVVEVQ